MSQLIVIGFDAEADAFALRQELGAAQKEYLLKLEDAVVVTRPTEGEYQLHQALNLTSAGALGGGFWGGLIGLRLVAENPDRFARVVVANTGLPTGEQKMTDAFRAWLRFSQESPNFRIGRVVANGCATPLPPEVVAAYDAPFPDERYTAGPRVMPALVPAAPDDPAAADNRAAWEVLSRWEKPFLTAFSDQDAVTRGGERVFRKLVPGAQGMPHTTLTGGGHFLQEDVGPELARVVVDLVAATPR